MKAYHLDKSLLWDEHNPNGYYVLSYYNRLGFYRTKTELRFISSYCSQRKKIIDLGGGNGRIALPLIKQGCDVTLIDPSISAIESAKRKGILKTFCQTLESYSCEEKFDIALAIELTSNHPVGVIKKAAEVLQQHGICIFIMGNNQSWKFKLRNLKNDKSDIPNLSLDEYITTFISNGFDILKIEGFNWIPFGTKSNNFLIPVFEKLENIFVLRKWISQSPWLMFAAVKR